MNHMAEVAKVIGVELDKVFKIKGLAHDYVLKSDGLFVCGNIGQSRTARLLEDLIIGAEQIEWIPQDGEEVWGLYSDGFVEKTTYLANSKSDVNRFKNGMIFRTEAEAIAKRDALGWVGE